MQIDSNALRRDEEENQDGPLVWFRSFLSLLRMRMGFELSLLSVWKGGLTGKCIKGRDEDGFIRLESGKLNMLKRINVEFILFKKKCHTAEDGLVL